MQKLIKLAEEFYKDFSTNDNQQKTNILQQISDFLCQKYNLEIIKLNLVDDGRVAPAFFKNTPKEKSLNITVNSLNTNSAVKNLKLLLHEFAHYYARCFCAGIVEFGLDEDLLPILKQNDSFRKLGDFLQNNDGQVLFNFALALKKLIPSELFADRFARKILEQIRDATQDFQFNYDLDEKIYNEVEKEEDYTKRINLLFKENYQTADEIDFAKISKFYEPKF